MNQPHTKIVIVGGGYAGWINGDESISITQPLDRLRI